ncbi:MAG: hypothetical protein AAF620_10695, partial [Bacteroidota bacterium]
MRTKHEYSRVNLYQPLDKLGYQSGLSWIPMCVIESKRYARKESFAKLDFWFKSRLSEFQKRSLLVVNEAFEILSNEELGQKASFSKDS